MNMLASKELFLGFFLFTMSWQIFAYGPKKITDAEIIKIVTAVNNNETEMAQLAKEKSKDKDIQKFATHMISQHHNNNNMFMTIANKFKIAPKRSEKSETIEEEGKQKITMLKNLEAPGFDKAYIDAQVSTHQKVITELDNNFIPASRNNDVKSFLKQTRASVEEHLEYAKRIQSSFQ